jgi:Fe-S-cluster containining protein
MLSGYAGSNHLFQRFYIHTQIVYNAAGRGNKLDDFEQKWAKARSQLESMKNQFVAGENHCIRCGRCCREAKGFLTSSEADVDRWRAEGRDDILSRAHLLPGGGAELWFSATTGKGLKSCPFLKKAEDKLYSCGIHETRPTACREWWCVLNKKVPVKAGDFTRIGAWDYRVLGQEACSQCGKKGICREHSFVSEGWLEKYRVGNTKFKNQNSKREQ